jgi:hypothetical protein
MNAANLKSSDRLRRVDKFLADRRPHSTMEIIQGASVCAVNSIISELRANGRTINTHRHNNVWYHRRVR